MFIFSQILSSFYYILRNVLFNYMSADQHHFYASSTNNLKPYIFDIASLLSFFPFNYNIDFSL